MTYQCPQTMTLLSLICPSCSKEVKLNLSNSLDSKGEKSITCQSCNVLILFEFKIKLDQEITSYRDYDWLYDQYVIQKKTMAEIARECGKTPMTIHGWLKKHGIKSRTVADYHQ